MLATLFAAAGEGSKEVINPVLPELSELFWGTVFFFTLLILMWAVCLPPIKKAMRQRVEQVQGDLEAAERAKIEAEQVRRDYDATLAEARREATRIIDEARRAGEAVRVRLVGAADSEVAAERQGAMADIEAGRQSALVQLRGSVGELAVAAASKVVQKDLSTTAHQAVVDAHVDDAGGLS